MSDPTLTEFLLARIAEDERGAALMVESNPERIEWLGFLPGRGAFAARMLAECGAKRRIVEWHADDHYCTDKGNLESFYMPNAPLSDVARARPALRRSPGLPRGVEAVRTDVRSHG